MQLPWEPVGSSPADFALRINREIDKYAKIIRAATIRSD